jgi:cytochrome b pre-mRNA-processing protein 3
MPSNMNITEPAQGSAARRTGSLPLFSRAKTAPRPSFWDRFSRRPRDRDRLLPLYEALVARGRDPFWYREAGVPDTVTGRFDMMAAMMSLVLLRFEAEDSEEARHESVWLTELFVEDMDESLHEIGIGEYVVGKHVGKMMSALGGRLGAFRTAAQDEDYRTAVRRNIYHEEPPREAAVTLVAERLKGFASTLRGTPRAELVAGRLPQP